MKKIYASLPAILYSISINTTTGKQKHTAMKAKRLYKSKKLIYFATLFISLVLGLNSYVFGQTNLISAINGGFESGYTGWTLVNNGTTAPTWLVNTAAGVNGGTNAIFIGTSTNTYSYSTNTAGYKHFYRDVAIPAGVSNITLQFWLKMPISDNGYDYINVNYATTSQTPVVNTAAPGTNIYSNTATTYSGYNQITATAIPNALAGTTVRLIFTYRHDGVTPFANPAIDDITLNVTYPPTIALSSPSQVTTGNIGKGATNAYISVFQAAVTNANATLNSLAFTTTGNAVTTTDLTNFKLYYGTSSTFASATAIATLTTSLSAGLHTFSGLTQSITSGTTGYFWITCDVPSGATTGRTITVSATHTLAFASGTPTSTITAGGTQTIAVPSIALSSPNPAVAIGSIVQNTQNNVIYRYDNVVTVSNATMSGLQITTAVGYVAADLTNLKAWYSSDNVFSSGSDVLLSTKTATLGPGIQVFPTWTNQVINSGTTGYIFITADIPCTASAASTISVNAVAIGDVTFLSGTKSGSTSAGGAQTITSATPVDVTGYSASVGDAHADLAWTNPAGCYDEVMIVAKATSSVAATPSGNGSSYTASLAFGSGTAFDGGFVVYKGSTSPQTVTGLTNGTLYYYKFFTRKGTNWSAGVETSATPVFVSLAADRYQSKASGNWTAIATWQSSHDGTTYSDATLAPTSSATSILINSGHAVYATSGPSSANLTVTGTYEHQMDGGTIPTATWNANSTCLITGNNGTAPGGLGQTFQNFTWNSTGQGTRCAVYNSSMAVNNTYTIESTGTSFIYLNNSNSTTISWTLAGKLKVNGGEIRFTRANGNVTFTINGDLTIAGGTLNIDAGNGGSTVSLLGNFNMSNGTLSETGSGSAAFNFSKSGTQTYIKAVGTISGAINFTVNAGSTLDMADNLLDGSTGTFTVTSDNTSGIITAHAQGLSTTPGTGSVQVTGAKTYNTGANYTFDGTVLQETGNGLIGANNLTISNSAGVNLTSSATVSNLLTLTAGNLNLGATSILTMGNAALAVAGSPSASNMIIASGGGEMRKSGTSAAQATYTFPIGDNTGTVEYSPVTLTFTGGTYAGYAGLKVANAKHPSNTNTTDFLNRYWTITPSGYAGYTASAATTYTTADITGTEANLRSGKWTGSLPWQTPTFTLDQANNVLTATGLTAAGITVNGAFTGINSSGPTVNITANPGLTVCQNTLLTLTANATGDPTLTYLWSPGGATTSSISPSTTSASSTLYSVTVTDGNGFQTSDNATVVVNQSPGTAAVGSNQNVCGLTSNALGGNAIAVGTAVWSKTSGPGNVGFSTVNNGSSTATVDAYGSYVLRWTFPANGSCASSFAEITVAYSQSPGTAAVGSNQNICGLTSNALGGNAIAIGTAVWSKISGPGNVSFSSVNSGSSTATADAYGSYVLRWTFPANGSCGTSFAEITVVFSQSPGTAAIGSNQNICGLTSNALGGNAIAAGTAVWSKTSGPGNVTFSTPNSGSSTATVDAYGSYVLRWTFPANGSCASSFAEVTVVYSQSPGTAAVGSNQNICGLTSTALGGNAIAIGTAVWSKTSGPGNVTFSAPNSGSSTATVDAYGSYVLRWTFPANGSCGTSYAEVSVVYSTPLVPSVTIAPSANPVNSGTSVTFTPTPTNGGTPSYIWWVNGSSVGSGATYNYTPNNLDQVYAVMTSTITCVTTTTATSGTIIMNVNPSAVSTWTGSVSNAWGNNANWNPGLPGTTTDVIIPASVPNYPILSSPVTVKSITIKSDASFIDNGGLTATNGATVERYIAAANWTNNLTGWHFLSSPVAAQAISPNFTPSASGYDFYAWNEPTKDWVNYKNNTVTPKWSDVNGANFVAGKGYMVAYQQAGTKSFTGTLNVADVPISNLTMGDPTSASTEYNWHLLGNPFPSALTWDATPAWNKSSIGGVANIWNESAQSYTPRNAGDLIPAMNGFMVKVGSGTNTITIPASKRAGTATVWYKSAENSDPVIKLFAKNTSETAYQESQVRINPASTADFDFEYDGEYLPGFAPQFYSVLGSRKLNVNSLPEVTNETVIPFAFEKNTGTNFSIEFKPEGVAPDMYVYLTDKQTGTETNLTENPVYNFSAADGDAVNRFELHFLNTTSVTPAKDNSGISVYVSGSELRINQASAQQGKVYFYNVAGQLLSISTMTASPTQTLRLQNLTPGVYLVNIKTSLGSYTRKVIINK